MANALLSVVYYWPDKGGMFAGPREGASQEQAAPAKTEATQDATV